MDHHGPRPKGHCQGDPSSSEIWAWPSPYSSLQSSAGLNTELGPKQATVAASPLSHTTAKFMVSGVPGATYVWDQAGRVGCQGHLRCRAMPQIPARHQDLGSGLDQISCKALLNSLGVSQLFCRGCRGPRLGLVMQAPGGYYHPRSACLWVFSEPGQHTYAPGFTRYGHVRAGVTPHFQHC